MSNPYIDRSILSLIHMCVISPVLQRKLASMQELCKSTKAFYKREKEAAEEAFKNEMGRTAHSEARVKQLQSEQVRLLL